MAEGKRWGNIYVEQMRSHHAGSIEQIWDMIHIFSDLRAGYNCFVEKGRCHYACSLAIRVLREETDEPNIYSDEWDTGEIKRVIRKLKKLKKQCVRNGEYEHAVCVGIEKLETKLDVLESGKEKVI